MKLEVKTVLVLLAVLLIAVVGSAYLTSWVFTQGASRAALTEREHSSSVRSGMDWNSDRLWDAGQFTVNLDGSAARATFMRTSMTFLVNDRRIIRDLDKRRVQLRDRIITVLHGTPVQEVRDPEGLDRLKGRIMNEVNQLILEDGGHIHEVYFSDLVIQ